MKHGCGVFSHFQNKTVYDGEWRKNKRDGIGSLKRTTLCGIIEYFGRFEDNKRHGKYIKH